MVDNYSFQGLGLFTRTMGLVTLITGRVGSLAIDSLYPIITRNAPASADFKEFSNLIFQGVAWLAIPMTFISMLFVEDMVLIIYGNSWSSIIGYVFVGFIWSCLSSLYGVTSRLLLAQEEIRATVFLDAISGALMVLFALIFLPFGIDAYLQSIVGHGFLMLGISVICLVRSDGISLSGLIWVSFSALLSSFTSIVIVWLLLESYDFFDNAILNILVLGSLFAVCYVVTMRLFFPASVKGFTSVMPYSKHIQKYLLF